MVSAPAAPVMVLLTKVPPTGDVAGTTKGDAATRHTTADGQAVSTSTEAQRVGIERDSSDRVIAGTTGDGGVVNQTVGCDDVGTSITQADRARADSATEQMVSAPAPAVMEALVTTPPMVR